MISRPFEASGDILPALSPSDLLSGPAAAAAGLRDHLALFPGDWWEYPDRGNQVFDLLSVSRRTEKDAAALASCLSSYILEFPAIRSLSGTRASIDRGIFSFSCAAHTGPGESFPVHYSAP